MEQFDTIIIGCGVSGASLAYHLAVDQKKSNIVVVEKGELFTTGGSTTHAPGGVLPYNLSNRLMARWGDYSVDFYQKANSFYTTGIINLAKTEERLKQYELEIQSTREDKFPNSPKLVTTSEIQKYVPGIDTNSAGIKGGILYPTAGRADAIKAINFMCDMAKKRGVQFWEKSEVSSIVFDKNGNASGIKITGKEFTISAKNIVIAAGAWGRNLYPLPIVNIEHQYVLYQLNNSPKDFQGKFRHQDFSQKMIGVFDFDSGQYYNEFGGLLGIGNYNHATIIVPDNTMVGKKEAENPFTPKDFEKARDFSTKLFPALNTAKMLKSINGFMTFTVDGYPYVGPVPGHSGLWAMACIWVTHAPGVGKTLAEWISTGRPNPDEVPYISTISPQRFPIGFGKGQNSISEIQEIVKKVYSARCALPDLDYVVKIRNSNPIIPFVKNAAL